MHDKLLEITMTDTSIKSVPIRYLHHKLPCGRVISIGFTAPAEKKGKILMAFSFCSEHDNFSRKLARERLNKRIEFKHPKVIETEQKDGQHINDVVIKTWNDNKDKLTPIKWLQTAYPSGVMIDRPTR
jgi:hypothetical protein